MYQSADQPVRGPDHHPADEVLGTAEGLPAPLVSLLHSSHQHSPGINIKRKGETSLKNKTGK